MTALLLLAAAWRPHTASWYDTGRITADGTRMRLDGRWVATYAYPLGTRLEVCGSGGCMELVVRDRTARKYGHRLDIPRETWRKITGAKVAKGLAKVKARRV